MDLMPIVQYLEHEGLGTIGKDLFRNHMPAQVDEGLLVTCQMPIVIDRYIGVCRGSFQVIARSPDWERPRLKMIEVTNVLNGQGMILGNMLFHYIKPRHEPMLFPKSESDLVEASVNFDFVFGLS